MLLANAGQVTLAYFLMLIAMTFNWGLFISVVTGISCGYALLLREKLARGRRKGGAVGGGAGSMLFDDELPQPECCA